MWTIIIITLTVMCILWAHQRKLERLDRKMLMYRARWYKERIRRCQPYHWM